MPVAICDFVALCCIPSCSPTVALPVLISTAVLFTPLNCCFGNLLKAPTFSVPISPCQNLKLLSQFYIFSRNSISRVLSLRHPRRYLFSSVYLMQCAGLGPSLGCGRFDSLSVLCHTRIATAANVLISTCTTVLSADKASQVVYRCSLGLGCQLVSKYRERHEPENTILLRNLTESKQKACHGRETYLSSGHKSSSHFQYPESLLAKNG